MQALAANVDVVLVVEHLEPDPDLGRIERLLTLAWRSGARPVVVLTKADLVPDPDGMTAEVEAVALAVDVHTVSVPTGQGPRRPARPARPGCHAGRRRPLRRREVHAGQRAGRPRGHGDRRAAGRRARSAHHDPPRAASRWPAARCSSTPPGCAASAWSRTPTRWTRPSRTSPSWWRRAGSRDCHHTGEPGCAVRAALDSGELPERRYDSWRRLAREAAYQARRSDARLAAEDRHRWKKQTQEYHRGLRGPGRPRS